MSVLSRRHVQTARRALVLLAALFSLGSSSPLVIAQSFSHSLAPRGSDFFFQSQVLPDTIRLLGVMVQFQVDDDPRTTGDGRFELFTGRADSVIDAPPHDRSYFKHHLQFVENYFRRVSEGRVIIQSEVLEPIVTLSKQMQAYSPQRADDLAPVAMLVTEAWRKADSLLPGFDFSRYQSFVIFHAGVGRDINLQQIFGFDPTPFDIPSLYLNLSALKSVYGSSYRGVPVNGGRAVITNSMIIPESENRLLPGIAGPTLLELSINGLLCASFGSFLGLPDLFDTKTGRSGIGRFGLMDGQAIFSFNGLFPPEPSAWEKVFLGWVKPIEVQAGMRELTARAVGTHDGTPSTIYKVPINAKEYFLVENRNRDPGRDGQRVKAVLGGRVVERFFSRDTSGFNATDTRAIRGVVIDVEDFDWSLPGGVDQQGTFYDGGILIWHIDENVIEANIASNTVNASPNHRGVDLEEADGSQDIGQIYEITQAGAGSESGTALDFWYRGNSSPVYKHAFTPTSHPNSLSNTLANSHVYIMDFSERGPTMTFKVQIGDDFVTPLIGFPKFVGGGGSVGAPIAQRAGCPVICNNFFVMANNGLYGFRLDGNSLTSDSSGLFDVKGVAFQPALPFFCTPLVQFANVVGVSDSSVFVWNIEDSNGDGRGDLLFTRSVGHRITTLPVTLVEGPSPFSAQHNFTPRRATLGPAQSIVAAGDADGGVSIVSRDSLHRFQVSTQSPVRAVLNISGPWIGVAEDRAFSQSGNVWNFGTKRARYAAGGDLDGDGIPEIVVVTSENDFLVFNQNSSSVKILPISFSSGDFSAPAIGDVDGDGRKEIVIARGNKIFAFNSGGTTIDNFPIELPSQAGSSSPPVLARIGLANTLSLFVGTSSGLVYAYDSRGKVLPGFPLAAGGSITNSLALFAERESLGILAATDNGYLNAWTLPLTTKAIVWGNLSGDPLHSGIEGSTTTNPSPISKEFLPSDRVYNWPNPVYGSSTQIRYYLNTSAAVTVKIFDLAGDKVAEMNAPGVGGVDNEVSWDVSNVQSGVYIARIEANGGGEHGVALVKIAVVK